MKPHPFLRQFLSPATARFILSLLALLSSVGATFWLMRDNMTLTAENVVTFALGQLFALTTMCFGYYFGSTARGEVKTPPPEQEIV